jgi:putative oxidoreductase
MIDALTAPYGVLLLRGCLGTMFIAHALYKWRVDTIPAVVAFFESIGLPGWTAYVTIAVELGGGLCLILGIYPRYVALLLMPTMIGTIVKVHGKNGWRFTNKGGGWEYPAFWTAALLAVFLMGDGAATLLASPSPSGVLEETQ